MSLPEFIVSVDLGQVNDPSAICVLERREEPPSQLGRMATVWQWTRRTAGPTKRYQIIHLERVELGTAYTMIPKRIHTINELCRELWIQSVWERERATIHEGRHVRHHPTKESAPLSLVIDQTGAGRPVLDLFREAGLEPLGITITGGDSVTWVSESEVHVAKRHLVSTTQAAMQSGRIRAATGLRDWPTLRAELSNFKAKISLSGHASFEAGPAEPWREGAHDDLVLALAMGLWAGENDEEPGPIDPFLAAAWDLPR